MALEDEAAAGHPERGALLEEMARRAKGEPGRSGGVHAHDIRQDVLKADTAWPVKFAAEDVAMRVVSHLQELLDDATEPVEPLKVSWKVFLGIQTGADAYSQKIRRRLDPNVRAKLENAGVTIGTPVYALPPGSEGERPWIDHPECLVKSPEPESVLYGALDRADYVNLVWLTRQNPAPASVINAVENWRPLLAARAEFVRNRQRAWSETCWPRNRTDLQAPKVIALHRTDRGRFALDEDGEWSPSGRMSVVVSRGGGEPLSYLCGVLNSELLDLWYALRGRRPRDVWRDYEPKPMNEMPYRRAEGDSRADRVAELVRRIAANRRALLRHRPFVPQLRSIIKDPWRTGPVEIQRPSLISELRPDETVSVRLDPELTLEVRERPVGRASRADPSTLVFRRARKETGRVEGPPDSLDLLEQILGRNQIDDVSGVLLPRDLGSLARQEDERKREVERLLAEGRQLVEEVERLVCSLYDMPDDLTEEVIAHALRRAESAAQDDGSGSG